MRRRERAKRVYTSDSEKESTDQEVIGEEIPPLPIMQIEKGQSLQPTQKVIPTKKARTERFDNKLERSKTLMVDSSLYDFNKYNTKNTASSIQSDISMEQPSSSRTNTG